MKLSILYQNNINEGSLRFTVHAKSTVAKYATLQEGQLTSYITAIHLDQITVSTTTNSS